ncbi:MAG: hypothetical protein AUJ92_06670 [Armatimonadetes bacterium CG2_30_59_28]|nr:M48 family metalloprotease [Armatimonadota bacterium]OIO96129.1 MAG: hypothetical protein AUJ92_06670 [Armatimonadetes bacterium CG2_30_59_28]PIU63038.1 MAG: hypothetical protein COS85_16880 [Armatimonadetes bacterium CG07_land_8_20_14_0_80_59_28]PIX43756.1 MAG: hypothetical protein COZ56_06445 [Armatimonadetes bacterium CG_4_8_14_3_um_filter_58_9]PIY48627.1 MAG: hypothetical protein COZ05_02690 [Armatimonadetes bacterium CG_4_10_14_3_um_filter_59_10]PJB66207.1 MAG: hypothetical protein CO0
MATGLPLPHRARPQRLGSSFSLIGHVLATRKLLLLFLLFLATSFPPLAAKTGNGIVPSYSRDLLWRQEGKDLTNAQVRLYCVKMIVTLAWLGALIFNGRAAILRRFLGRGMAKPCLVDLAFFAIVTGALHLMLIPFNFLNFLVERAYGQVVTKPLEWLGEDVLHLALTAVVVPVLAVLAYRIIRGLPTRWWWFLALGAVPVNLLISVFGPIYGDMLSETTPLQNTQLRREIFRISKNSGVNLETVRVEKTSRRSPQPRAYVTGLGPSKRIVLSDNLLRDFDDEEVLFAVAHEVGHYALGHLWIDVAIGAVAPVGMLYLLFVLGNQVVRHYSTPYRERITGPKRQRLRHGRSPELRDIGDPVSYPVFVLIVVLLGFLSKPVTNALSRWVEHAADVYALERTVPGVVGPGVPLRLFERIGSLSLSDAQPNAAVKMFFFAHPPIDDRIDFCKRWWESREERRSSK